MKTFLTFVFQDFGAEGWFTDELFDESHVRIALEALGVLTLPGRRERLLQLELSSPLSAHQQKELVALQEQGLFSSFILSDEAIMREEEENIFQGES